MEVIAVRLEHPGLAEDPPQHRNQSLRHREAQHDEGNEKGHARRESRAAAQRETRENESDARRPAVPEKDLRRVNVVGKKTDQRWFDPPG